MPYAQQHYPFENKQRFEKSFPADFIAEGIDQTRGWFYTLLVISTILFDKPPFKNLIVNGLVLAADGKKMSKRLKNYPDPMQIVHKYGADALRMYLIDSPVVKADSLRFQEKGVRDCLKDVLLPWFNAFRFLVEGMKKYQSPSKPFKPDTNVALQSKNLMDRWILAASSGLIKFVRVEMEAYRLYTVIPRLVRFVEQLTNWYIKLNRRRIKGGTGSVEDTYAALCTLFEVLFTITKAMAPVTPFITEFFYQTLKLWLPEKEREDSVHYLSFPVALEKALDPQMEEAVRKMQNVITLGRQARERRNKPLKFPLRSLLVIEEGNKYATELAPLMPFIVEELNVSEVKFSSDVSLMQTTIKPNHAVLGKRLGADMKKVQAAIANLKASDLSALSKQGSITVEGHTLKAEDLFLTRQFNGDKNRFEAAADDEINIVLDIEVDQKLFERGLSREVINRIQKLRKKCGLHPTDPIEIFYDVSDAKSAALKTACINDRDFIENSVDAPFLPLDQCPSHFVEIGRTKAEVLEMSIEIVLCRGAVVFDRKALLAVCDGDEQQATDVQTFFGTRDYAGLLKQLQAQKGSLELTLNGKKLALKEGTHVFKNSFDQRKKK